MKIKAITPLASSTDVLASKEADIAICEFGSIHYGDEEFECFLLVRDDDAEAAEAIVESLHDFGVIEVIMWAWEGQRCFTVKEARPVVLDALSTFLLQKHRGQCPI